MANNLPHNPTGKGLKTKYDIEDKDKQLAKDIMSFNLKLFQMYNTKPQTPEELADRFANYFQMCLTEGRTPTMEGLALVSNYERKSFYEISKGEFSTQFTPIVKKAKDYVISFDAELAAKGKIPAPIYIFRAKNYAGMKDTQDIQISPTVNGAIPDNADEIIDKLPERTASDLIEGEKTE